MESREDYIKVMESTIRLLYKAKDQLYMSDRCSHEFGDRLSELIEEMELQCPDD